MNIAKPHRALAPTLEGEALIVLARTTRPLSGRDVARLTGRSQAGINRALRRLAAQGLADIQEAPPALLYTLNREHVLASAVELLANVRREFVERLRTTIESWQIQPTHASLFGSAARGDGDVESDIDLFVVRPKTIAADDDRWRQQVDDLAAAVRRWSGNVAAIAEVSGDELRRLRQEWPPIVDELRTDAVTLAGPPPERFFGSRR